jgi:hypothetical protein
MATDNVTIDLTNYKDRVGARVSPGKYRVQVEDVEASESSNHNPMVNVWFRIMGDPEFEGQTVVDRLTMTEKSMFRVVNFMQAIGLPTPKKRLEVNIRRWVGQILDIVVDDGEPYLGKIKSEVREYIRVPKDQRPDVGSAEDDLEEAVAAPSAPARTRSVVESSEVEDEIDLDSVSL